jgi:hypothetical protein
MTPKEKAEERVNKYFKLFEDNTGNWTMLCAKYCALVEIDEIIEATKYEIHHAETYLDGRESKVNTNVYYNPYYKEVKQEIEKS